MYLKTTKTALSMIAVLGLVAACETPTTSTSKAAAPKPAAVAATTPTVSPVAKTSPTPVRPTVVAQTQQLTDGTYTSFADGQTATIVVRGGQPVSYRWGSYTASRVSMRGNRITIDQAQLNLASMTTNSFSGTFVLRGERTPVVFTKT